MTGPKSAVSVHRRACAAFQRAQDAIIDHQLDPPQKAHRAWPSLHSVRAWANTIAGRHRGPERAAVVTASYGGVDRGVRRQMAQDIPVDWIVLTDDEDLRVPPPWRVVHAPARFARPALAAKVPKMMPPVGVPDVVWIDASLQVTSHSFVRNALAARHDGVAAFIHPRRDCIFDEAAVLLERASHGAPYADQPIKEQVAAYRAEGHPLHAGLYACGVLAWDLANPHAVELGRAWLAECERWSFRDQVSFPVLCRRLGITPGVFPVPLVEREGRGFVANRWLRIWPHTEVPYTGASQQQARSKTSAGPGPVASAGPGPADGRG
ncbi:MAG TPA: hypothetical protein VG795_10460 [Acidimicrobiia bacterium]|nr:hypothetical protein [Acidimicrobiia bacterium]